VGQFEQQSGPISERKLFEYVAEIQAQSGMSGKAPHLANPAALGGETLRLLQGYFERANKLHDSTSKRVQFMSEDSSRGAASAGNSDLTGLHGGPARQNFEPAERGAQDGVASVKPVGDADLDRTVDMLMRVLSFAVETNLLASGSGSVSRSVNTLLRGQ